MLAINKIFVSLLVLNLIGLVVFFNISLAERQSEAADEYEISPLGTSSASEEIIKAEDKVASDEGKTELEKVTGKSLPKKSVSGQETFESKKFRPISEEKGTKNGFTRKTNPFNLLGAYPEVLIQVPYRSKFEKPAYHKINYGLVNDDDYCDKVDQFNFENPQNMFKKMNFFSDYTLHGVVRGDVIPRLGKDTMKGISKFNSAAVEAKERTNHFDESITTFFVNKDGFHKYHEIGKHFLCATQMYNRVPGSRALIRKDELVQSVDQYADKFKDKPDCFNKQIFFPYAYRLYLKGECSEFFEKINSDAYKASLKAEPIQYIIKISHGSHSAEGVYLMDTNQTEFLNTKYDFGKKCGLDKSFLIAQSYITNPLLLDLDNKFDFRIYMLVASTNPLIVYYHDGFLRASLSEYDKFSQDRSKHLTNTHIAESTFKDAKQKKINGMTEEELRDYHIWKFEKLQDYLLKTGKINDTNWLENSLRPQFKKAIIHLVKMSSSSFWKQSNVYGLFGLDFMLDDKFNLWFIEGNPNPQLLATSEFLGKLLSKLLKNLFEIEYGLYRSRMTRVLEVVKKFQEASEQDKTAKLSDWQLKYRMAAFNRFEPQYAIGKKNSWSLVMDESLPKTKAYFGNIAPECVL